MVTKRMNFPGNPKMDAIALSTDQKGGYLIGGNEFLTPFSR